MPQPAKNTPTPLPPSDLSLGKRLAKHRKALGLSQEALAEVMGLSRKQVVDYETGRVHLNDEMIVRFALTLKISADEILGLKPMRHSEDQPELRFTRRLRDLSQLPEDKKRAVLKILDDLIRANR
jgi:transcriptional regulator with XRE-family HTH domain